MALGKVPEHQQHHWGRLFPAQNEVANGDIIAQAEHQSQQRKSKPAVDKKHDRESVKEHLAWMMKSDFY